MLVRLYIHHCARMIDWYRRRYAMECRPHFKRAALRMMTHQLIELDRTLQRYA